MAAKMADNSMEDIANSLTESEVVPTKLRCAICDKVAFNAYKLPCCDQNICGNCQSSLPEACPICQHSPLNADDAKPSKSLRLTVAQFLKSVKKKREKAHTVSGGEITPTQPAELITLAHDAVPASAVDATLEASEAQPAAIASIETPVPETQQIEFDPKQEVETTAERVAEEDAELQQLEATTTVTQADQNNGDAEESAADGDDEDAESDTSEIVIVTGDEDKTAANPWGESNDEEYQEEEQWNGQDGQDQMQMQMQGYGYQGGDQGDMSNMFGNMTPDMMQMMMQQMNGMQNGNWPNMMAMPNMGMGMSPMDMFAAFGMQGMGGMNPNMMNLSGMNGMMGMDFNNGYGNGGWNGQQMNGGDYGASTGYYPDGGYNQSSHQGNYPSHNRHNQQFSMKNDSFHNQRGSFRGRGYGRGYHNNNQGYHGRSHSQNFPGVDNAPPPNAPTGPKAQRETADGQYQQTHNRTSSKSNSDRQQPITVEDAANKDITNDDKQQVSENTRDATAEQSGEHLARDEQPVENTRTPLDQSFDKVDYFNQPNGTPAEGHYEQRSYRGGSRGRGFEGRGGGRGRGSYHGSRASEAQPTPPAEQAGVGVQGAPSGPKAMREGNAWAGRGRGGLHGSGRGQSASLSSGRPEDVPDNRTRSRSRSQSHDRSKSASRHHSRRHRSRTPASDSDRERRKEHRKRRSERRHEDVYDERFEEEQDVDEPNDDKYRSSRREHDRHRSSRKSRESSRERRKHRRRSRSHDDMREDLHVSSNGDDANSKEKERHRDREKYRDRSRDRDRHRDKDRDRERDKKRPSRRDRSASPDSQHRSSQRRDREKEKEKERERDREREQREQREQRDKDKDKESRRASVASVQKPSRSDPLSVQKQLEQGFRVHGRSKEKERDRLKAEAAAAVETVPPPAASTPTVTAVESAKMQPPTGPRADRSSGAPRFKIDIANLNTKSTSSSRRPSQSGTPTSAVTPKEDKPMDPYEEERRKAQEARIAKEFSRRKGSDTVTVGLTKKRSWADAGGGEEEEVPTGPRDKKRVKGRKMSYKYEDDGEIGRGEGERESARYR